MFLPIYTYLFRMCQVSLTIRDVRLGKPQYLEVENIFPSIWGSSHSADENILLLLHLNFDLAHKKYCCDFSGGLENILRIWEYYMRILQWSITLNMLQHLQSWSLFDIRSFSDYFGNKMQAKMVFWWHVLQLRGSWRRIL